MQRTETVTLHFNFTSRLHSGQPMVRHLMFAGWCAVSLALFHGSVGILAGLAVRDDRYTSTLAIPFISFGLVWLERRSIFASARYNLEMGLPLVFAGLAVSAMGAFWSPPPTEHILLRVEILALAIVWAGAFVWCYGTRAARAAMFPLVFLVFMIPIPAAILTHAVAALQKGSAEMTYRLFKLANVPVLREGAFQFSLPGVKIEIAQECSGIRSSESLFISSILAGYVLLRSTMSRSFLAVMTVPIVIFKNAVRIVTISLLGVYVDPAFLHGRLHRYGGLPFSVFALALMAPVLLLLMRTEGRRDESAVRSADCLSA